MDSNSMRYGFLKEEDSLFDEWEHEKRKAKGRIDFVRDGVVDEERFNSMRPRIVFVLKDTDGGGFDLREFLFCGAWNEKSGYRDGSHTWGPVRRVLRKLYELQGKVFPSDKHESLRGIAAINIKKEAGCQQCPDNLLDEAVKQDGAYIFKQLSFYDQSDTVFICCRTSSQFRAVLENRIAVSKISNKEVAFEAFGAHCAFFESGHHPMLARESEWDERIVRSVEAITGWFGSNTPH